MGEVDEFSQELLLEFLRTNFPIKRLKDGKRFKRGIKIESGFMDTPETKVFLNKKGIHLLYAILSTILDDVFGFSKQETNIALFKYLKII